MSCASGVPGLSCLPAHRRQVRGTEPVDDALHAAGLVEVPPASLSRVELLHAAGGAEQGDQVAAGRGAPDADAVRVEVVLRGVGPQPADGRLAVFDLGREDGVLAQAVVDAGHGVALGGQRARRGSPPCCRPASPRRESRRSAAAGPRPSRAGTGRGGSARGRPRRTGDPAGPGRPPGASAAAGRLGRS